MHKVWSSVGIGSDGLISSHSARRDSRVCGVMGIWLCVSRISPSFYQFCWKRLCSKCIGFHLAPNESFTIPLRYVQVLHLATNASNFGKNHRRTTRNDQVFRTDAGYDHDHSEHGTNVTTWFPLPPRPRLMPALLPCRWPTLRVIFVTPESVFNLSAPAARADHRCGGVPVSPGDCQ